MYRYYIFVEKKMRTAKAGIQLHNKTSKYYLRNNMFTYVIIGFFLYIFFLARFNVTCTAARRFVLETKPERSLSKTILFSRLYRIIVIRSYNYLVHDVEKMLSSLHRDFVGRPIRPLVEQFNQSCRPKWRLWEDILNFLMWA